ncbi:MAG: SIS domain-containing protein [Syntrophaceae bacterium]|nr:SIS domain-containing protein [Syntrophaceae bacterium]
MRLELKMNKSFWQGTKLFKKQLSRNYQRIFMIFTKIFYLLSNLQAFILQYRIYIGRRPKDVKAPALIFFPILSSQLNCGFAGLMTCNTQSKPSEITADITVAQLWEKIKSAGKNIPAKYLNGLETIQAMETAVAELKREDAQEFLFFNDHRAADLSAVLREMKKFIVDEEKWLEENATLINSTDLEIINSRILNLKDNCYLLEKDILDNLQKVQALIGAEQKATIKPAVYRKYRKLNLLLNALDRLEVRGRDSAGIQLSFVLKNKKEMQDAISQIRENGLMDEHQKRSQKSDLFNSSISVSANQNESPGSISVTFTYKTFSIVGELGRNVSGLRNFIQNDRILRCFANTETISETAMAHTRWASVGSITEENCHPINNYTTNHSSSGDSLYSGKNTQINVVLNGDIDNYQMLRQALEDNGDLIDQQVTTDAKIIPLQIEKYLKVGQDLTNAFRLAVNDFEGSHAIAMTSNIEPGKIFLALRGSGQSIYVGINSDQYMFSSELYGLVEVTPRFLKMNGETNGGISSGQIFVLNQNNSGIQGIAACFYDSTIIPLKEDDLQTAEITTRDIDRSSYPHYFLKEISESTLSVKRTLRGKYRISATGQSSAKVAFNLGSDIIPDAVRTGIINGKIKNIIVIGHGTAAVAGQAIADALTHYLSNTSLHIINRVASELSGFGLKDDLTDTLVIPITQSGTTTDTNRAVAMVRERGSQIISIVNRRQSDITAQSHGVFYTSDGRDVEMSVASTKAFYAQIVAGQVLALFFAQLLNALKDDKIAAVLRHLESVPSLMDKILASRDIIAASVKKATGKRYWAVVGSGPNKAAADEIRIKLSELCYKTISSDYVENKKHIDLSAEPLILVFAAGSPEAVMEDIVKDVAIFKAHKATVIVFANEGDSCFNKNADAVIHVPVAPSPLPVLFNTMAGHLWGYYAACAIDEDAQIFRKFRGRLAQIITQKSHKKLSVFDITDDASFHKTINEFYSIFNTHRQNNAIGLLEGKTIADLTLLLKYAAGKLPLQEIYQDFKYEKDLFSPYDLLDVTLGTAIDELTRTIDAIRHQAKTVTVGTSRKEKEPEGIIFYLLKTLNFYIKDLTYRDITTIKRIQPAIAEIRGYTIYDINHLDEKGNPADDSMIVVRTKSGIASGMKSRADNPTALMGVKRTIVSTGHIYLGRGKMDSAPIMIIPLRKEESKISNLLLIHIIFNEALNLSEKITALGYQYNDIRNLINEYNLIWNDRYLESFSLESLFSEPTDVIAGQIKLQYNQI